MGRRSTLVTLGCLTVALALRGQPWTPLHAEAPKKGAADELSHLRHSVQKLQKELHERDQKIQQLQHQLKEKDGAISKLRANLKAEDVDDAKRDKELGSLRQKVEDLQAVRQARYVQTMILRLKSDAKEDQVKSLLESAPKALGKIQGVRAVWVGKPATVTTESATQDYQVGLTILLDDADAARRFLDDPAQKKFSEGLKKSWETTTVYNFMP